MTTALEKIIGYAVHLARPERIILFGSLADGRGNVYSDVDLVIVTRLQHGRRDLEVRIGSFVREFSLKADVLIRTPEEVEKAALNPTSFLGSVVKGGKIVYERDG